MEECVWDMEQSPTCATRRGARISLSKEECASGTGQRSNFAALKVVQTNLRREGFAEMRCVGKVCPLVFSPKDYCERRKLFTMLIYQDCMFGGGEVEEARLDPH